MLLGSIQVCRERVSRLEMDDICVALRKHKVRLLALRECRTDDDDFQKLMTSVSCCRSILHLNLNLGVVNSRERSKVVRDCLVKNRSLNAFFVHGSPLGEAGARSILKGVALHPNITSLDIGDCQLTDKSITLIADLLPHNGAKRGLKELTLTANNDISPEGWTQLFIAISASSCLRTLNIDYNNIGDYGVGCLAVAMASNHTLKSVDMEGCGITEFGGKVLLNLIRSYPVSVKQLILTENNISSATTEEINSRLQGLREHIPSSERSMQDTSEDRSSNCSSCISVIPLDEDVSHKTKSPRSLNIVIREPMLTSKTGRASNMMVIPEQHKSRTRPDMDQLSESDDTEFTEDFESVNTDRQNRNKTFYTQVTH